MMPIARTQIWAVPRGENWQLYRSVHDGEGRYREDSISGYLNEEFALEVLRAFGEERE